MTRPRIVRVLAAAALSLAGLAWAGTSTPVQAQTASAQTYTAYTVGIKGGEPSIGFDPVRNAALYGSGTNLSRLTWDAAGAMTAANVKAPTAAATLDAITMVDQATGRTFNSQLVAACSLTSFSDDAGAKWTPSQGCGEGTVLDHQSLGGGPYHAPIPANAVYPDATYYCAQDGFNGTCALSANGGVTFGPGVVAYNTPANDPTDPNPQFAAEGGACSALHGHIRVGPDGTAYLPLKGCGGQPDTENGTNSEFIGGRPALSISTNNGATWQIHEVPAGNVPDGRGGTNAVENPDESDPSVGISRASAAHPNGVVYYGWENGHNPSDIVNGNTTQAMVSVSTDDGNTWSTPTDVSSPLGLNNVMFPEVIAGNDDSAAFAFLGTPATGDDQANAFPKDPVWDLYISTTYDGGQTWTTVDATPNDPVQRGCIDLQGTTIPPSDRKDICSQRNLLDFNDITVDRDGRVLVAYGDGCNAACAGNTASGSSGAVDMVMRQTGGVGLYARPTSTSVSCAPATSGSATTCTATVADAGDGTAVTPGGVVGFGAVGAGTFALTSCTLAPTASAGVASCSVTYTPSAAGAQTINAGYGGELSHKTSVGAVSITVSGAHPRHHKK